MPPAPLLQGLIVIVAVDIALLTVAALFSLKNQILRGSILEEENLITAKEPIAVSNDF
ncbi:hypothetical protein GCM10007161_00140 [Ignatzschineria indica]|nr:hypothetical protein GCM10007161_00140 [Ignatzschineria indica]